MSTPTEADAGVPAPASLPDEVETDAQALRRVAEDLYRDPMGAAGEAYDLMRDAATQLEAQPAPPATPWDDDLVQFARLIAEMEAFGAFGGLDNWHALFEDTDWSADDVRSLIDRAQAAWEAGKEHYTPAPALHPCDHISCGREAVGEVFNENSCRTLALCQKHFDKAITYEAWSPC